MDSHKKLFWLLFFLPIGITGYLAHLYFIDLPLADYWDVLHRGVQLTGGSLGELARYAWAPFVDQKMVFSKLFIRSLALHTQNTHYFIEIVFGFVGQSLVLILLWFLLRQTPDIERGRKSLLLLCFSWLLFWPNILVRFQHHWYSTQYTFVMVFGLLAIGSSVWLRGRWVGVVLALLFAICSAVSHGTGLIFLLCYGLAIVAVRGWTTGQKGVVAAVVLGVVAVVASEIPPRQTLGMAPLNWFTTRPLDELSFIFRCFGPDGVLRAQTGFVILALGLTSCWKLFRRGRLLDGDYFCWLLIFFWGGSVAFISGVTRSAASSSPFRVYFYFFVLVLVAVLVLAAIVWPKDFCKKRTMTCRIAAVVLAVLYIVGCADGVHDATKIYRRTVASGEKLQFQPLLVDRDYRDLFPLPRIQSMLRDLHEQGMLDGMDTRELVRKKDVRFKRHVEGGVLYFIPDRPILSGEVVAFDRDDYQEHPAHCFWKSGNSWEDRRSQELLLREAVGKYWVLFIARELPRYAADISAIKLQFVGNMTHEEALRLTPPTVWSRPEGPVSAQP